MSTTLRLVLFFKKCTNEPKGDENFRKIFVKLKKNPTGSLFLLKFCLLHIPVPLEFNSLLSLFFKNLWKFPQNYQLGKFFKIFLKNSTKFYSFLENFSFNFSPIFSVLCPNFSFYVFEFWGVQQQSLTPFRANLKVFKSVNAISSTYFRRIWNFFQIPKIIDLNRFLSIKIAFYR